MANMLVGGGKSPILTPTELHKLGFMMVLYPTTILFSVTKAIEKALTDILAEKPLNRETSVTFEEFEKIVDKDAWTDLEKAFGKG